MATVGQILLTKRFYFIFTVSRLHWFILHIVGKKLCLFIFVFNKYVSLVSHAGTRCAAAHLKCSLAQAAGAALILWLLPVCDVSEVRESENDVTSLPRAQLDITVWWRGARWISAETEGSDARSLSHICPFLSKFTQQFASEYGLNSCWNNNLS